MSEEFIYRELTNIDQDLQRLTKQLQAMPYEEFIGDEEESSLAERRFERIVNYAINLNIHILRSEKMPPPKEYKESFIKLGELKILPIKLATDLAPAAGLRNILVHEYERLEAMQFYSGLQKVITLFPVYIKAIRTYVENKNSS